MPQLDPAFWPTQIFWLLVTFVPLYLILWKVVLPRIGGVLEARQRHIDDDLENASSIRLEADEVMAEYERAVAEARAQATAAVKQAGEEMSAEGAKRHDAFARELSARIAEAETRIAGAKEDALAQVTQVAAEVASAATAKLIGVRVGADQVRRAIDDAMRGGR